MHFARVLRAAGLPVGPGKVLDALRAVEAVGIGSRSDFYWTLHAVFVNRRDQRELFDQAFHIFWRKPDLLEKMMQLMLPQFEAGEPAGDELSRRLAEALGPEKQPGQGEAPDDAEPPVGRARRDAQLLGARDPAAQGLRADVEGRGRRGARR